MTMALETDPETLLKLVWSAGLLGQAFVVSAALALAGLAVVIGRVKFRLELNTRMFLAMIEKLMMAGNPERALKLTMAHNGPVALLLRAGLRKYLEPKGDDAAERAHKVEAEMKQALPWATALAQKGMVPAQVLAGGAMTLGVAVAIGPGRAAVVGCGAVLAALLVGFVTTVRQGARFRRELAQATEILVGLVKMEALK